MSTIDFLESLKQEVETLNERLDNFLKGFKSEYKPFLVPEKTKQVTKCEIINFKKSESHEKKNKRK